MPTIDRTPDRQHDEEARMKRAFDIVVAGLLLVLTAPMLLIIAVLVGLNLGRPVIFRQLRPGKDGKPFWLYKFRSMRDPLPEEDPIETDRMRITRLGSILRNSSLDELPELYNVLRGDMSLVGPRPLLMEYLPLYTPTQSRRHELRPGITGWAQIHGRNNMSWEEKFSLDVWYVDNHTLLLDCRILIATILKVLRQEGISKVGHATTDRYRGAGA